MGTTHCQSKADFGKRYAGTQAVTENGNTCQNWTSGGQGTAYEDLNEPNNFCRNPDPIRASRVWCFIEGEDGVKKLEYCPVPDCDDVPLGIYDFEQYLSKTNCPPNYVQQSKEEEEGSKPEKQDLPVIDLLLNPGREDELEQLQQWVEENEANATYTEV